MKINNFKKGTRVFAIIGSDIFESKIVRISKLPECTAYVLENGMLVNENSLIKYSKKINDLLSVFNIQIKKYKALLYTYENLLNKVKGNK